MHGQHALCRQQEVEDGEDRFFAFAGVGRAANQHQPLGEIDQNTGFRVDPVAIRIGGEAGRLQNGKRRFMAGQFVQVRRNEQVARE
jgi:hypothetical protein